MEKSFGREGDKGQNLWRGLPREREICEYHCRIQDPSRIEIKIEPGKLAINDVENRDESESFEK